MITDHGRATPLVWLTVDKRTLKDNARSLYEHRVLVRLAELLPGDVKVCVVADRGFGDQKPVPGADRGTVLRLRHSFRGNIAVTATTGETRTAAAWVRSGGRACVLRGAAVTADRYPVGTVVCVPGPRHEAGLVPRRQQHHSHSQASHWILCPPLGYRVRAARYQGSALRHGAGRNPCQIAGAARDPGYG